MAAPYLTQNPRGPGTRFRHRRKSRNFPIEQGNMDLQYSDRGHAVGASAVSSRLMPMLHARNDAVFLSCKSLA